MTPPRVAYIGCVPVERSYHGSLLLYRLLQTLPPGGLSVVEGYLGPSRPDRRLPGVDYRALTRRMPRLRSTRFAGLFDRVLWRWSKLDALRLPRKLAPFQPQAVVTVAHGHGWRVAAAYAARRKLPLHMIVHDDWPSIAARADLNQERVGRAFAEVYKAAASRLCVSPAMAEVYRARYGVAGTVLYPCRAPRAERTQRPARLASQPFTLAFAGSVNTPGYAAALRAAADAVAAVGGRLRLYGPLTSSQAAQIGLARAAVDIAGLVDSDALLAELAQHADALFLPMSFVEADAVNMQLAFPSKLTDYTAAGLPLLIFGPAYCSAARWARENDGVCELVTLQGGSGLQDAVARLAQNPVRRAALAQAAMRAGDRDFSHAAAAAIFLGALAAGGASR